MRKIILTVLAVFLTTILYTGCKHDTGIMPGPVVSHNCDPDTVYFQNDILPVFLSSCGVSGCHDPGTAKEGVILTSYSYIMQTGKVKAGNPNDSEILEVMLKNDPDDRMPPAPRQPLDPAIIDMIRTWIQQGALNNSCESDDCDSLNVTYGLTIEPLIKIHCVGCHSGPTPQGNLALSTYSDVAAIAQNGTFLGAITHEPGYVAMPYNGNKLSDCQIAQVKKWINDGYPQN